jgi:hypothetical protein
MLLPHGKGAATSAVRARALAAGHRLLALAPLPVEADRLEPGAKVAMGLVLSSTNLGSG